jgi:hypothetical protein
MWVGRQKCGPAMEKERRKKENTSTLAKLVAMERGFLLNDLTSFQIDFFEKKIIAQCDKTQRGCPFETTS